MEKSYNTYQTIPLLEQYFFSPSESNSRNSDFSIVSKICNSSFTLITVICKLSSNFDMCHLKISTQKLRGFLKFLAPSTWQAWDILRDMLYTKVHGMYVCINVYIVGIWYLCMFLCIFRWYIMLYTHTHTHYIPMICAHAYNV